MASLLEISQELKEKYGALTFVVGLPKNLKGQITVSAKTVLAFVDNFKKQLQKKGWNCVVETFDERLSTKASERTLIEAGLSRVRRREVVDGLAAAFMLQGYLDRLKS